MEMAVSIDGQSSALRDALTEELRRTHGADPPQVLYAWSRAIPPTSGSGVVMFARVRFNHRSTIVDAAGPDGDTAFARLVERASAWSRDGHSAPAPPD
jgi:hypothetical protein